jgi:hypothetical protein
MSAIAIAERDVAVPLSHAFACFIDFTRWGSWMPHTFSPLAGPIRALTAGDRFKVSVGRLPLSLEVIRLRPNAEVCWRGGSRWVMQGEHSFTFTEEAGKTRIRSEEKLSGLLSLGPLASRLSRAAAAESRMILDRFADYAARHPTP